MGAGNLVYYLRFTAFREVTLINLTIGHLVANHLILMFQYLTDLLVGVLEKDLQHLRLFG